MKCSLSLFRLPVIALIAVAMLGCGGGTKGTVKGKVTSQNAPLTGYVLNLVWKEKGFSATIPVDAEGAFNLNQPLETGTYVAYLTPKPPEPQPPGAKLKKETVAKIPAKYVDSNKSDLKVTIKPGGNEALLSLTD